MIKGYIPQKDRKKIMLLCDDIRMTSGISTIARELVVGTSHIFNWINVGGAINHPDNGKRLDICQDTNDLMGINDSSVFIYPINGYGSQEMVRQLIDIERYIDLKQKFDQLKLKHDALSMENKLIKQSANKLKSQINKLWS